MCRLYTSEDTVSQAHSLSVLSSLMSTKVSLATSLYATWIVLTGQPTLPAACRRPSRLCVQTIHTSKALAIQARPSLAPHTLHCRVDGSEASVCTLSQSELRGPVLSKSFFLLSLPSSGRLHSIPRNLRAALVLMPSDECNMMHTAYFSEEREGNCAENRKRGGETEIQCRNISRALLCF